MLHKSLKQNPLVKFLSLVVHFKINQGDKMKKAEVSCKMDLGQGQDFEADFDTCVPQPWPFSSNCKTGFKQIYLPLTK